AGRRITLSEAQATPELRTTLRHEVCHAVDDQNGLVDGHESAFSSGSGLVDDVTGPSEVFADLCMFGVEALGPLWSDECPSDPDLEGAEIVRRDVLDIEDPEPAVRFVPIASTLPTATVPGNPGP